MKLLIFPLLTLAAPLTIQRVNLHLEHQAGPVSIQPSSKASPTFGIQNPSVKDGVAQIHLRHAAGPWNVGISPKWPLNLRLTTRSGDVQASLTGLPVETLNVDHQGGDYQLKLPSRSLTGTLKVAAADMELRVPADTGLKLNVRQFRTGSVVVAGKTLAEGTDLQGVYQTDNFDKTSKKIVLDVLWDAGDLQVVQ